MRMQGPFMPAITGWLAERSRLFDVNVFFTYLYYSTWAGLPAAAAPTVLHPTAHDEPPIYLPLFDAVFRLPTAFAFSTEEEAAFVHHRFRVNRPSRVIGIGIDLDRSGDVSEFRRRFELGDRPYIVCVGRIDPAKGSLELHRYFAEYLKRHRSDLVLVFIGEEVTPLPPHPGVVKTGFVDEQTRDAGIEGAELLVQPSYFESFSLVLCESWAMGVPALVQGANEVLVGQSMRSGGGLAYRSYQEFEVSLDRLLADPPLRRMMGQAGRSHVERKYRWSTVLERYEGFLETLIGVPLPASMGAGTPKGRAGNGDQASQPPVR
jgi:glycosyltransferase involved in cell wall biosynthesis